MAAQKKSNELKLVRIYDAPVKAVWDAWTDPKQAAQWWGPRGFTITTHSKDLRPGGHWTYTMHGPDGTDYRSKTIYHEVIPQQRLVYDHGGHDDRPPIFRVTVNFAEVKGKTRMEMTMALPSPEAAEETRKFIKKAGGDSTWDRLAEYLENESSGKDVFVINRAFDAPVETVFEMWANPEHLARWLAPTGASMKFHQVEIKPDGKSFYTMSNGKDMTLHGRTHYLEVKRPSKLVYTQQFCDEKNEKVTRHYLEPTWPETMLTTVTFEEEGPGRTRVTVRWEVYGEATPTERKTFNKQKAGMTWGWTGSFDKLEEVLAQ